MSIIETQEEDFSIIEIAEGWGISFRPEYHTPNGILSFGTPEEGGKYPCTKRVADNYIERHSRIFAFVEHPEHGLIAVSKPELDALGLAEIEVRS
jgi:hypothetical protein